MTTIRSIRRHTIRIVLAVSALLGGLAVAPAAFAAQTVRPGDGGLAVDDPAPAVIHPTTVGGTPGWQIALFTVAAALLAAALAVTLDRARTARHRSLVPDAH